jgi:hypothetical protein
MSEFYNDIIENFALKIERQENQITELTIKMNTQDEVIENLMLNNQDFILKIERQENQIKDLMSKIKNQEYSITKAISRIFNIELNIIYVLLFVVNNIKITEFIYNKKND